MASTGKPGSSSTDSRTGLTGPVPGAATGGVMRLASGTRSVSTAQPVPSSAASASAIGVPGM